MHERIQTWLEQMSDYLWAQFEKDIAFSQKVLHSFDKVVATVHDFFSPKN